MKKTPFKSGLATVLLLLVLLPNIFSFNQPDVDHSTGDESRNPRGANAPFFVSYLGINSSAFSPQTSPGQYDNLNITFEVEAPAEYNVTITHERQKLYSNSTYYAVDTDGDDVLWLLQHTGNGANYTITNSSDGGATWNTFCSGSFGSLWDDVSYRQLSLAIAPNNAYWYLGFVHQDQAPAPADFMVLRSADKGQSWEGPYLINSTPNRPYYNYYSIDIDINSTGAVFALCTFLEDVSGDDWERAMIMMSENNGASWAIRGYYPWYSYDDFCDAAIAVSPTTGYITGIFTFNDGTLGRMFSNDKGVTFSNTQIDSAAGLIFLTRPNILEQYRTRDIAYDSSGRLFLAYLGDRSIRYAYSDDNGANWVEGYDLVLFRAGSFEHPVSLCAIDLTTGMDAQDYIGNLTLVYLDGQDLRDFYVKRSFPLFRWNGSLLSNPYSFSTTWDGKDFNLNYLLDGRYTIIAQVWNPGTVYYFETTASEVTIEIDNQVPTFEVDLQGGQDVYLSPASSAGIQDEVDFTFVPSEAVSYHINITKEAGYEFSNQNPVVDSIAYEHQPDICITPDDTLFAVYASNVDGNLDIFIQTSTDFGTTWSLPKKIVGGNFDDYDPCIAVTGQNVYVAWSRVRNDNPELYAYLDLFFIKSTDNGGTWSVEKELTYGYGLYDKKGGYFNPDIAVDSSGNIYLSVTEDYYDYDNWGEVRYVLYNSSDQGGTWQRQNLWNQTSDSHTTILNPPASYPYLGDNAGQMSLVIDSNDYFHVVYDDWLDFSHRMINYSVSTNGGNTFINDTTLWDIASVSGDYSYLDTGISINKEGEILVGLAQTFNKWVSPAYRDYYLNLTLYSPMTQEWQKLTSYNYSHIAGDSIADNYGGSHFAIASGPTQAGFEFIATYSDDDPQNFDVIYQRFQSLMWERSGIADAGVEEKIHFNGFSQWNAKLPDGNYTVLLKLWDAGNMETYTSIRMVVDNTAPTYSLLELPSSLVLPTESHLINIICADLNLDVVTLVKKNNTDPTWVEVPFILLTGTTYQATLQGFSTQKNVRYQIVVADLAGNTLTVDDNGEYWQIYVPEITHSLVWGSGAQPTTYDLLDAKIHVSEGAALISRIELTEIIGADVRSFNMTLNPVPEPGYQATYNISLAQNYTVSMVTYNITCIFLNAKTQQLATLNIESPDFNVNTDEVNFPVSDAPEDRLMDSTFRIAILKSDLFTQYIDHIDIRYTIQDEPGEQNTTFTYLQMQENATHYWVGIEGSQQIWKFDFEIIIYDSKGITHTILSNRFAIQQEYIPQFPEFNPTPEQTMLFAIVSCVLGVLFGFAFVASNSHNRKDFRRNLERQLVVIERQSLASDVKMTEADRGHAKTETAGLDISSAVPVKSNKSYLIASGLLFALIGAGLLLPADALMYYALAILVSTLTFIQRVVFDSKNIIRGEQGRFLNDKFYSFLHVALILVVIFLFLFAGYSVPWFNYYIIQDTYDLGFITIPKLYVSLIGVFVSSILLITFSTFLEVKDTNKRTKILRSKKANWRVLLFHKEENISKVKSRAGLKAIVFIVTLGYTVISTTQLLRYANIGLPIIAPFVAVFAVILLLNKIVIAKFSQKEDSIEHLIVEQTKTCTNCGQTILFDSVFCSKCGHSNAGQNIVLRDIRKCPSCATFNAAADQFCRSCGHTFEGQEIPKK